MFAEKGIHFDLITYGGFFYEGMDILDEFPSQAGLRYAERIVLLTSQWNHILSKSAVMFFPHISFYRKFSMQVKLASYYYNPLRFIIYCEEMVMNDLLMVAKPMYLNMSPGHIAMYQYFLIKSNNGIELVSFEWFTEKVCNYPMINSINIFDTNLMKWKNELEIPEKFRNFYGCMLTIGLTPGRLYMHIDNSGNPFGPPIDLFKAMATLGNFTFNHQILQRDINGGFLPVPQNGIVMDIQVYFQIPRVAFSRITDFMHLTTVFLEEKVSFVLTDAEPYSSYEKLILPFDNLTWIFCLVVFFCAFTCIFVINITSPNMQKLFYGHNVNTPALNVIEIFFGSSQTILPFENFPRIILMTFILFCLVLRTAYQGVLFELVAGDIRKPLPKSIDDLYRMNYKISVGDDLEEALNETIPEELKHHVIVMDVHEQDKIIMQNITDSALRMAHCSYYKILKLYQNHIPSSGGFLQEDLFSFITGFMLLHFHFLFELTDETVQLLLTGGILQHSFEMETASMNYDVYNQAKHFVSAEKKSKVLTMDDLSYGFTLWMISCMITLIVFLLELTMFYLGKWGYDVCLRMVRKLENGIET